MSKIKVLVIISHPAHVHFFKNFLRESDAEDIETKVVIREREFVEELLDNYGFDYKPILSHRSNETVGILDQLKYDIRTLKAIREFGADIVTAVGGTAAAHSSTLSSAKSLIFTDTEHATIQNAITFPFADVIYTPECYQDNIGDKQRRYPGYHELAYLHPNRFEPNPKILDDIGIGQDDRFVVLRVVDWNAIHDIGDSGFDDIEAVVKALEEAGDRVYITAEGDIPAEVEHCQISVEPQRIHHLMYYADLFIGESATMATESAVLGTPAIFVSTSHRGYTDELEEKYGLVRTFSGPNRQKNGLDEAVSLLENYNPEKWDRQRKQMLGDKIDTTEFITDQINDLRAI